MPNEDIISRITDYLASGGLFNPELVRQLLIDCIAAFPAPKQGKD